MCKIVLNISLFGVLFLLLFFSEGLSIYATEALHKTEHVSESKQSIKSIDSCTERCHVNYMAYENKFESSKRMELFRHKTHSIKQGLDCKSCHDEIEVNTEGHGELIIERKDCLKCHHVESEDYECKGCHIGIDENPMRYDNERFLHGFTVDSSVDCGLCHIKNPNASLVDKINCVKCHHTTPDLDCIKCHESDISNSLNTDTERSRSLLWTVPFDHLQHPEQDVSCMKCHLISHENDVGIVEYNLNCSKCHHVAEEDTDCIKCHKEPLVYLRGEIEIEGITSIPDMMSRALKCEDCHKLDEKELKFKGVREYCIECHNNNYGKLHDAWRNTIVGKVKKLNSRLLSFCEEYQFPYTKEPNMKGNEDEKGVFQSDLYTFLEMTSKLVDSITKYGMHNFSLTRLLLDYLEQKITSCHGEAQSQKIEGLKN
jgi:hypothetical protein